MKYLSILILFFGTSALADQFTFKEDVRPIFSKRCSQCHNSGNKVLPNLLDYKVAFSLKRAILDKVVYDRSMPHSGKIKESEREVIEAWVQTGAQE